MLLRFPSQRSMDSFQKNNSVAKKLSKEVLISADQSSRCCIKVVKEMEDTASLMADYMGMMKRNTALLFGSNTILV